MRKNKEKEKIMNRKMNEQKKEKRIKINKAIKWEKKSKNKRTNREYPDNSKQTRSFKNTIKQKQSSSHVKIKYQKKIKYNINPKTFKLRINKT